MTKSYEYVVDYNPVPTRADESRFAVHKSTSMVGRMSILFALSTALFAALGYFLFLPIAILAIPFAIGAFYTLYFWATSRPTVLVDSEDGTLRYETDIITRSQVDADRSIYEESPDRYTGWNGAIGRYDYENRLRRLLLDYEGMLPAGASDKTISWECVAWRPDCVEIRVRTNGIYGIVPVLEQIAENDAAKFGNFEKGVVAQLAQEAWDLIFRPTRPEALESESPEDARSAIHETHRLFGDDEEVTIDKVCLALDEDPDSYYGYQWMVWGTNGKIGNTPIGFVMDDPNKLDGGDASLVYFSLNDPQGRDLEAKGVQRSFYDRIECSGGSQYVEIEAVRYAVLVRDEGDEMWFLHAGFVERRLADFVAGIRRNYGKEAKVVDIVG